MWKCERRLAAHRSLVSRDLARFLGFIPLIGQGKLLLERPGLARRIHPVDAAAAEQLLIQDHKRRSSATLTGRYDWYEGSVCRVERRCDARRRFGSSSNTGRLPAHRDGEKSSASRIPVCGCDGGGTAPAALAVQGP
jgi:hypothetical protein